MELWVILSLVWLHFFADFVLQTDKIALNKSNDNEILLQHVAIYAFCFLGFGPFYALANMMLHFITDWFTSRITKRLWLAGERHWFFVVIGIDQAIHMTCLFATYDLLAYK